MKKRRLREAEMAERDALDQMPLRVRTKSTPPEEADDKVSLVEEGVDVTLTDGRISRVYRPYHDDGHPPGSPVRSPAPTIDVNDI